MVAAGAAVAVKQEPAEPELTPEPETIEGISPSVVLERLSELLSSGRVLLRYPRADGWGVNGKLEGQWCSFRAEADGSCTFTDETAWATGPVDEWAEAEVETLEELRGRAQDLAATKVEQPDASRPRECRRAVFDHHRGLYAQQAQARARAAAAAKAKAQAARPQVMAARPKEAAAPPPGGPPGEAAAWPPVGPPARSGAQPGPAAQVPAFDFVPFKDAVKARLLQAGQKSMFKEFLVGATQAGLADRHRAILAVLIGAGHQDLADRYRATAVQATVAKAPAKAAAPKAPPAKAPNQAVDVEQDLLAPLRALGVDAPTQLVRLAMSKRGARASTRLAMLGYVRSQVTEEGSFRHLVILRGAPGTGKSAYALDQLRFQAGLDSEEEAMARSAHICASEDFFVSFAGDGGPVYAARPGDAHRARAWNEARVRLAMKVGLQTVYVADPHMRLWEMAPYVRLAKAAGYDVSVFQPEEIFEDWDKADALAERAAQGLRAASVDRSGLEGMLKSFEAVPGGKDPLEAILEAQPPRGGGDDAGPGAQPETLPQAAGAKRPLPAAAAARVVRAKAA